MTKDCEDAYHNEVSDNYKITDDHSRRMALGAAFNKYLKCINPTSGGKSYRRRGKKSRKSRKNKSRNFKKKSSSMFMF